MKIIQKRLAMVFGSIVGITSVGLIATFALLDANQEIPDTETGTIGYALKKIIGVNWQSDANVLQSRQLGGVDGGKYLRLSGTGGCANASQVLRSISPDGTSVQCETVTVTRPRPILATIRDLDSSCFGTTITNTGTFIDGSGNKQDQRAPQTLPINNSDPIDLYEDDTIETTAGCSLASLYMPDNSIIRLSASTKITLRYAGIPGGSGATSTDLDGGEMWARVLKPITDDSYFNINTQEASVGVRGTSVWIQRDSTNKKTTALPIDSGKLTQDDINNHSGAIVVYPKHGDLTALGTPVPLTHTITVDLEGKSQLAPYRTSTTTQIYQDKPFVRMATLADIKDFKALEQGVGNLATIQANKFDLTSGDLKERYNSIAVAGSEKNTADLIQINTTVSNEILETYPKSDPSNPDNDERSALCLGASSAQQWWDAVPLGRENCIESNISFLADYSKNDSNLYGSGRTNGITNSGFPSIDNGGIKIENNNEYIKYNLTNIGDLKGGKITIYFTNDIPILPAGSPIRYVFGDGNNKWRMGIKANKDVVITRPAGDIGGTGSCIGAICYFQFGGIVAPENPLVLGNYYRSSQNDYPGPIKSTIKSINISNP